jgi:oligoendopeptidase F
LATNDSDFSGPSWNNSTEYPALTSNEFTYDQQQLDSLLLRIEQTLAPLFKDGTPAVDEATLVIGLQAICEMEEQAAILIQNMSTFANCLSCVDGSNKEALAAGLKLADLAGSLEALVKPVDVYLMKAPESLLTKYFAHAHVKPTEFSLRYRRTQSDTLLTEAEEALIARLRSHGPQAFGSMYEQLSSGIRCHFEDPATGEFKQLGLAEAAGLLRNGDEAKRRQAWRSIQLGWRSNETAAASGLNAIAGWRHELTQARSRRAGREIHFHDQSLHEARISRATLDAMMSAVSSQKEVGRRAVRAMAANQGKAQLDPWDLVAPAKTNSTHDSRLTFEKGLGLISEAFNEVDPSLRDFVDTMKKNRWIEGRQLPNKRPGAFQTEYAKSNSPRVYQTYMGSLDDVRTLAHELGHAYHSWVMRDLAYPAKMYPMTLAETASIFGETAFADHLVKIARESGDLHAATEITYQNAESAAAYLLNIPARFEFETKFYERRKQGFVSPEELGELTNEAWTNWYGDTLSENEKQFWMTKLHFSMPTVSFYNYPYTFGALFALGIYALRKGRGADFWPSYNLLLRDTGRMTAEDLAKKHMGVDLTKPDFWLKSISILDSQIRDFEALAK